MIFIDASAIISLSLEEDKFHRRAVNWRNANKNQGFVISDIIFIETLGWIRHKSGRSKAVEVGKYLISGQGIQIEWATYNDVQDAWELFQNLAGRGLSMVDCTSIVLMRRLKIKDIFTFDEDFKKLGFKVHP